jgi:hypothetical protein
MKPTAAEIEKGVPVSFNAHRRSNHVGHDQ